MAVRRFKFGLIAVCALALAVGIAACGGGGKSSNSSSTSKLPANSATGKSASTTPATSTAATTFAGAPTNQWLSVGGSLMHENYSPLTQINTSNVSQLKGVWHKHLGTAKAPIYSAEGQPIYDNGVVYISTGSDNVFAYQVKTGKLLWHYAPQPAISLSASSVVCCGWDNRAVGVGGGMVYIGQIDGNVVGLNQQTGKVVWKTQIDTNDKGATITMPITYYHGRVFAGVAGGEYEIRGFMESLNAKTGHPLWKFSNTATKGQPNGNTWSGKSALTGGASTWNAPSVDPQTNTIFYSTSNASPDFDGRVRAGKNLYTASILALDATTGALKWYYQETHHDIWDYDAPSETVLFNPKVNGKVVPAIAQPSKTGMLYVLNRDTGKALFPTPEKPVAQNKAFKTWPTQPRSPLVFSPQKLSPSMLAIEKAAAKTSSKEAGKFKFVAGSNFDGRAVATPNQRQKVIHAVPNGASGGDNWQPSSFDPADNYYYVCSQLGAVAGFAPNKLSKLGVGTSIDDTETFLSPGFNTPGRLTAFDMNTGKIAWQDKFPTSCYSGSVDTAGGIVFAGQNSGKMEAFNAKTGKLLWSFQTGAGANAPVAVFQDGGQEYVASYDGGSDLGGTPHGDDFWLFGLNGKLGPTKAGKKVVAGKHG